MAKSHRSRVAHALQLAVTVRSKMLIAWVLLLNAAALTVLALFWPEDLSGFGSTALLTLAAMAAAAGAAVVRIPTLRIGVAATDPFLLCALAVVGPAAAIGVALAGIVGTALGRRPRMLHLAFNVAVAVLAPAAAWLVFSLFGGQSGTELPSLVGPLMAATFAYGIANYALVTSVLTLEAVLAPGHHGERMWTAPPFLAGFALTVSLVGLIDLLIPWGIVLAASFSWLLWLFYRGQRSAVEA